MSDEDISEIVQDPEKAVAYLQEIDEPFVTVVVNGENVEIIQPSRDPPESEDIPIIVSFTQDMSEN